MNRGLVEGFQDLTVVLQYSNVGQRQTSYYWKEVGGGGGGEVGLRCRILSLQYGKSMVQRRVNRSPGPKNSQDGRLLERETAESPRLVDEAKFGGSGCGRVKVGDFGDFVEGLGRGED